MNNFIKLIFIALLFTFTSGQEAKEVLIYADDIEYDSEKNIIAKGNVKIINNNEIITSDLIIYNQNEKKYILPAQFSFKDEKNNYYNGTSGEFSKSFENAFINDARVLLNDGSRIVGKSLLRKGKIDLITKGSFTPCYSKINIKNFVCPIWQIEDEKLLHDRETLFLYHKHSKLRIFNVPVLYIPYLATPSPLRKKRKSGFLNPTIGFNFIDAKTSQKVLIPYYFNIDIDKELYFTPVFNYGGGVDSSQRFLFDYNQLISGGDFTMNVSVDTKIENQNNETWYQDASIISNYRQNLNEKFNLNINTAFQSSPTYLRRTDKKNLLNQDVSLNTSLNLNGYSLNAPDDVLNFTISGYQVVKKDDDNGLTPTALPTIKYDAGFKNFKEIKYNNKFSFYNIVRDKNSSLLSKRQQKLEYNLNTDYEVYKINSKINFKTKVFTQQYHTENKQINGSGYTGYYNRVFPMSGIFIETPIKNNKYDFTLYPNTSIIINGLQPGSDKISNEESINSSFTLINNTNLNRYSGTDKLDNSQRLNYGINLVKNNFTSKILQSYEFNANSNYNRDAGLKNHLSDILFSSKLSENKYQINYNNRYNVDLGGLTNQALSIDSQNKYGDLALAYSQDRVENNSILKTSSETFTFNFNSNKYKKYNSLIFSGNYDLMNDYASKYSIGYNYIDECFGIDINFGRNAFEDRDLKPDDTLNIIFSFKFLGSYSSTNLAVSETDKQDVKWESGKIKENNEFYTITSDD